MRCPTCRRPYYGAAKCPYCGAPAPPPWRRPQAQPRKTINMTLTPDVYETICAKSEALGLTFRSLTDQLLREWLRGPRLPVPPQAIMRSVRGSQQTFCRLSINLDPALHDKVAEAAKADGVGVITYIRHVLLAWLAVLEEEEQRRRL